MLVVLIAYGIMAVIIMACAGFILIDCLSYGYREDEATIRISARVILLCWAWPVFVLFLVKALWGYAFPTDSDSDHNPYP